MSGEPGGYFDGQMFEVEDHQEKWNARTEFADFEYVKTLGLKIIAGRDFSAQFPTDTTNAVLINKTAAANWDGHRNKQLANGYSIPLATVLNEE